MSRSDSNGYVELFRGAPVESSLLAFGPLVLALAQLGNGLVNDVPLSLSALFAITMICFAWVALGHQAATYRLRRLESGPANRR